MCGCKLDVPIRSRKVRPLLCVAATEIVVCTGLNNYHSNITTFNSAIALPSSELTKNHLQSEVMLSWELLMLVKASRVLDWMRPSASGMLVVTGGW